jgi:hypothetical protein
VLLLWARGLAAPVLTPGEKREVSLLRSLEDARLNHLEVRFRRATLERAREAEVVTVPAGEFTVERLTVSVTGGSERKTYPPAGPVVEVPPCEWVFLVEKAPPHRVVRWTRSDGFSASLTGSARMEYWRMNGPEFETALEELGLRPRPDRTP